MKLILASNSPRRKEILSAAGYKFEIICGDYEEKNFSSDPVLTAATFALGKARSVFDGLLDKQNSIVLGADTVVYADGAILGKASSADCARKMLKGLSAKTHKVITGYALVYGEGKISGHAETLVSFNDLSDKQIDEYIKSGLYKGKAGSYGIQDPFPLVKSFDGSLTNVIGLPIESIRPILDKLLNKGE